MLPRQPLAGVQLGGLWGASGGPLGGPWGSFGGSLGHFNLGHFGHLDLLIFFRNLYSDKVPSSAFSLLMCY